MNWFLKKYNSFWVSWSGASGKKRAAMFMAVYTAIFLVTFLLVYSPFLLGGKSLIWMLDGRSQHYPAMIYIGRYLRQIILNLLHGEFSVPLFDLSLGMGENVIGTLNYYGLGNPLYLLALFVPARHTEYLYNFLVIFRVYLSGLAFSALCVYHKKRASHTLIGALAYTFCGYAIFSSVRHPYFIDPMIQLPLLLIGIDLVIKRKKTVLFALAVFYSALCGFYFLYMMTIMLGIYALVKFFEDTSARGLGEFFCMVGRISLQYLWGIGMAAALFVPAVAAFLTSGRSWAAAERNYLSYGWDYYRDNLLRWFAPPGGWETPAFAGIALFALVLLLSQRGGYRGLRRLTAAAFAVYMLPLGGFVMNGFGYPSQRWTFGLALLMSYVVVEMLPALLSMDSRRKGLCFGTSLLYSLFVFVGPENRSICYVVGVAMLLLTLTVLLFCGGTAEERAQRRQELKHIEAACCALLVIANVSVNAVYRFAWDQSNYVAEFATWETEMTRLVCAPERGAGAFSEEGRADGPSFLKNAGAVWQVPTMLSYWSISNGNVTELWKRVENIAQEFTFDIGGSDQRTALTTLLSTKYFLAKEEEAPYVPYGYEAVGWTEAGNRLYQNRYALPWGYTYENSVSYEEFDGLNGLELEEAMMQGIALEERPEGFPAGSIESDIRSVPYTVKELKGVTWEDGTLSVTEPNAEMTLEYQFPAGAEGYLRLEKFDIRDSGTAYFDFTVKAGGVCKTGRAESDLYNWYFGRENYLFNLGCSEEAHAACTITFPKTGDFRLEGIRLYAKPMDRYPAQVEALRAEPLENIVIGTNLITGTVDLSKNKILCVSVPYSIGWSARVDGKSAEILRGNYMFMALPLDAGHHEIEFIYHVPGLKLGAALSAISWLGLAAAIGRRKRR